MIVTIINEAGYAEAARGLALSYDQPVTNMPAVMARLCSQDRGHNKFLETMIVWLSVDAPRHWWQEMDAYRIGITKQSASTMHTLTSRPLTQADFEQPIPQLYLDWLNDLIGIGDLARLKNFLPEGFLQQRIICTNYKTLRGIIAQRRNHRNPPWQIFCQEILKQVAHPEYLAALPTPAPPALQAAPAPASPDPTHSDQPPAPQSEANPSAH